MVGRMEEEEEKEESKGKKEAAVGRDWCHAIGGCCPYMICLGIFGHRPAAVPSWGSSSVCNISSDIPICTYCFHYILIIIIHNSRMIILFVLMPVMHLCTVLRIYTDYS